MQGFKHCAVKTLGDEWARLPVDMSQTSGMFSEGSKTGRRSRDVSLSRK